MTNRVAEQAETLLAELRLSRRRSMPFVALAVLAAAIALVIMAALVFENRRQARKVEELTGVAQERLVQLEATLRLLKSSDRQEPALIAEAIAQADAANAALRDLPVLVPNPGDATLVRVPPASVTEGVQSIAQGPKSGWDVDAFWCAGAGQDGNYARARHASILLGADAIRRRQIAPGVRLGRVRLRPIREVDRGSWESGFYVVSDGGTGEDEAGNAVARFLTDRKLGATARRVEGSPTAFYLSIIACELN